MDKVFTLIEYGYLEEGTSDSEKDNLVSKENFEEIEKYILSKSNENIESFLSLEMKNGKKRLKAKNFVGVLKPKNGIIIEILPKILESDTEESKKKTREIFLKMLSCFREFRNLRLENMNLKEYSNNMFEIFISIFIENIIFLTKRGLKSNYITKEENLKFFKGKFLINNHLKNNFVHKEKFYMEYDEFSQNIPENKLIKSVLNKLKNLSSLEENRKKIKELLAIFSEIDESVNYNFDFSKCQNNRLNSNYPSIINWCKIFLDKKTFSPFLGNNNNFALVFPMEKIFEDFITYQLKNKGLDCQKKEGTLFNLLSNEDKFYKKISIKPDNVIYIDQLNQNKKHIVILDTKWKILNKNFEDNYGISQSDLYQMFAYAKVFKASKVLLVYPKSGQENPDLNNGVYFSYPDIIEKNKPDDEIKIEPFFINLSLIMSENFSNEIDRLKRKLEQID